MKRLIDRAVKACEVLVMAAFFFGCSMQIDSMDRGSSSSSVNNNVRSLMNRADAEQMLYMGGAVLYSPKDPNANQLMPGAVIATRIGKTEKTNLGAGQFAYKNSKTEYELGFISVESISKSEISFTYFKFPSADSNDYVAAGNFSLAEGESADLNGDGTADVSYSKPAAGRKGYKTNMWLNFICDVEAGDSTAMFSIIPMQYERSVYPNGLLGINPMGQYIVNKYNVGSNSRSIVSNISYGDYVLDTEANTISRFVGQQRAGGRSAARAIGDSELEEVEQISSTSAPEEFEFKANEFTEEFDINQLLEVMPASIVTENWSGRSIAENVAYLNYLIRQPFFINQITDANSGDVTAEIKAELASSPITCEAERVIFARHALSLLYPEYCPDINLFSQTLSNILPWLYVEFGGEGEEFAVDENGNAVSRSIFDENNKKMVRKIKYDQAMAQYMDEARKKHAAEHGKKVEEYIEYEVKRDAMEKYFSTLSSYNFAPLLATLTGQKWLKDIVKGTKTELKVGASGNISFANANPCVELKVGVLLKFELENRIAVNVSSTSLFASSAPEKKSISELQEKFNKKFPDGHYTAEEVKDYIDTMDSINVKDELGLDSWVFDASDKLQKSSPVTGIRPSKDAKSLHYSYNPVPALPFVVTFDARLDILFKIAAVVEFDNFTVGGVYMTVFDCAAGIDWGFRKKFLGIPRPSSFYCDTYAICNRYSENAGFAGITSVDKDELKIGGGAKFTICPVLELRVGAGVGYSILGAGADVSIGPKVDFFAPLSAYLGYAIRRDGEPVMILDMDMDAGFSYSGDVQFCLDPPILSKKYWNYDIPGLKDQYLWQIFRLRLENFHVVKKEGPKRKA